MCGRYTLYHDEEDLSELFDLDALVVTPRFNVAPTSEVPIVRMGEGGRRERLDARWGLVPTWVKEPASFKALLFNARAETVFEKPSFRDAARKARCVVPASGFYEWHVAAGGEKRPHYVHRRDGRPLAFAGLYAERASGSPRVSATVLTTDPNEVVAQLHDRMPVILDAADFARWLDPDERDPGVLGRLLRPCPADLLEAYPVGREVGNARLDGPHLIERA